MDDMGEIIRRVTETLDPDDVAGCLMVIATGDPLGRAVNIHHDELANMPEAVRVLVLGLVVAAAFCDGVRASSIEYDNHEPYVATAKSAMAALDEIGALDKLLAEARKSGGLDACLPVAATGMLENGARATRSVLEVKLAEAFVIEVIKGDAWCRSVLISMLSAKKAIVKRMGSEQSDPRVVPGGSA